MIFKTVLNRSWVGSKVTYTGLFEMIVGILTTCHTQYTWDRSICIFYLIEQHSKFLLHTLQVLFIYTLCDSTNINTIIEFVSNCLYYVSGDGSNGGSDSYFQFRDTWGKRRNINLILDVTPQKEITWGCIWRTRWQVVKTPTIIANNPVWYAHRSCCGKSQMCLIDVKCMLLQSVSRKIKP